MADDPELYELAVKFPEAALALVGIHPTVRYRGEAIEVKATSGRFDAVLTPDEPPELEGVLLEPVDPDAQAPRVFLEFQNRHDRDCELRWACKLIILRSQTPRDRRGRVRFFALYGDQSLLDAACGGADMGDDEDEVLRFSPTRLLFSDIDPALLEAAGWAARVALPLVGTIEEVQRNAARWHRELTADTSREPEDRVKAADLFVRFLSGRLGDRDVYALLRSEEDVVAFEDTATGRGLIARTQVKEARAAILDVLDARGVEISEEFKARLAKETDLDKLRRMHRAAVGIGPDLEGLFAA